MASCGLKRKLPSPVEPKEPVISAEEKLQQDIKKIEL